MGFEDDWDIFDDSKTGTYLLPLYSSTGRTRTRSGWPLYGQRFVENETISIILIIW